MKRPLLLSLALFLLLSFTSLGQAVNLVGFDADRLARLDATLQAYVDNGELPGIVAKVTREGQPVYFKSFGYRDLESKDPMEKDDIFRIASQSKALISLGIMMLVEDGDLLITDPLGKYFPGFMESTVAVAEDDGGYRIEPAVRPITIRDLLTHTSGIDYGGGPGAELWEEAGIQGWYFAHLDETVSETVERMAPLPLAAQPGSDWVYGYNTDILGAVIERISGQSLAEFMQERVFEPLGMKDTSFYLPEEKIDRLVTVYGVSEDGLERAADESRMVAQGGYVSGPRKNFSGGAGLLSTADDYTRFLELMRRGGELDGVRLVSPKTVQLMTVNHVGDLYGWGDSPSNGVGFGLGFSVVEDLGMRGDYGTRGEFGWGGAYHTSYWVDPVEGLVVTYFTQMIPAGDVDDHQKFRALLYQAISSSAVTLTDRMD